MSLEKGPKATMGFASTERRFLRKVASEHCNTETKDGVNSFPEYFQGAPWERTELAHVTPSHTLQRGHLSENTSSLPFGLQNQQSQVAAGEV